MHTQANQPVCQPVCRDFQNGRCFRGSCRFYHGATDDLAAAQMAAGAVLGYHGGHAGMHLAHPAHPAHPAHALQRVMSLPSGGLPPFPGAGVRGRSFDAASALAMDPGIAAFLGGAQAIPGWQGDSAAAAALALAATQTSAQGGVPGADLASLLALQSAQLQMQQQHQQRGSIGGVNPREPAPADPNFAAAAMSQADQWAAIQARQAASADAAARGAAAPPPQPQTPSPATSGLLSQTLGVGVGHARVPAPARAGAEKRDPVSNGADVFSREFFGGGGGAAAGSAPSANGVAATENGGGGFYGSRHGLTGNPIRNALSDFGLWGARNIGSAGESNGSPAEASRRASFSGGQTRLSLDGFGGGLWEDKSGVLAAAAARTSMDAFSRTSMDIASGGPQPSSTEVSVGGGGGAFLASSPLGVPVNAAKLPADLAEPPSSRARSNYSLF